MNTCAQGPVDSDPGPSHGADEEALIQAKQIMSSDVVTAGPETTLREIALLFKEYNIGAVPVVDHDRMILGIVSKGDVICRQELGIGSLTGVVGTSHGLRAQNMMTRNVITVSENTPLADVAEIMQGKRIKHLPVVRKEKLVGIVSRTDVVRVLSARPQGAGAPLSGDDDVIRYKVIETLADILGGGVLGITVKVSKGVVELSGTVLDETKHDPSRLAVERIPHVVQVKDNRVILQSY
jgi:CBS domain-containing protein